MILPSPEEKKKIKQIVKEIVSALKTDAQVIIGGSVGKDTYLSGNHDIDIFVAFKNGTKDISKKLEKIIPWEYESVHGSRTYFSITYKGYKVELVPIIKVRKASDAQNITDMSPLHVLWVKKNSTEKLRNDIRYAKAFLKAARIYGAESYIGGFSGYVIEILVIHYGGFKKFLKAASKWSESKIIIDTAKKYKNKHKIMMSLNHAKLCSPIIVIDPTDKDRNAAAALSIECFEKLKQRAQKYIKKPSTSFFVKKKISCDKLIKRKGHLVYIEGIPPEKKRDIAGAAAKKTFENIENLLAPFGIKDKGFIFEDKVIIWFILKSRLLPEYKIVQGPLAHMKEAVKRFKKCHKKTFLKNKVCYAKEKRKMRGLKIINEVSLPFAKSFQYF